MRRVSVNPCPVMRVTLRDSPRSWNDTYCGWKPITMPRAR